MRVSFFNYSQFYLIIWCFGILIGASFIGFGCGETHQRSMPEINGVSDTKVALASDFDPMGGVSVDGLYYQDITDRVLVSGYVDTTTPGLYLITYVVKGSDGYQYQVSREIEVVDEYDVTFPELTLVFDRKLMTGTEFDPLSGITATDDWDGDITEKITLEGDIDVNVPGEYAFVYRVSDSSGNTSETFCVVSVTDDPEDVEAPVFIGVTNTTVPLGAMFDPMAGIRAVDDWDGEVTSDIRISGEINTGKPGIYKLIYRIKDYSGNGTKAVRIITVTDDGD